MKEYKRGGTAKRIIIGAIVGVIPGGIIVLLTVPVSGEVELTLGGSWWNLLGHRGHYHRSYHWGKETVVALSH